MNFVVDKRVQRGIAFLFFYNETMSNFTNKLLATLVLIMPMPLMADGVADKSSMELDVEQRMRNMDTNHDGMVTISEMRAYLESIHGKAYEKALLDEVESKANGKSCASPFTRSFY